jgi:hypothetical protein
VRVACSATLTRVGTERPERLALSVLGDMPSAADYLERQDEAIARLAAPLDFAEAW